MSAAPSVTLIPKPTERSLILDQVEKEEWIIKGWETNLQWFDESSDRWLPKFGRYSSSKKSYVFCNPQRWKAQASGLISNPAPWERARLLESESKSSNSTIKDDFGCWFNKQKRTETSRGVFTPNQDWGDISNSLPIHTWILQSMTENLHKEELAKGNTTFDIKTADTQNRAELNRLMNSGEHEFSKHVTNYLVKDGWSIKGGFKVGDKYGMKGNNRGDPNLMKQWNKKFQGKGQGKGRNLETIGDSTKKGGFSPSTSEGICANSESSKSNASDLNQNAGSNSNSNQNLNQDKSNVNDMGTKLKSALSKKSQTSKDLVKPDDFGDDREDLDITSEGFIDLSPEVKLKLIRDRLNTIENDAKLINDIDKAQDTEITLDIDAATKKRLRITTWENCNLNKTRKTSESDSASSSSETHQPNADIIYQAMVVVPYPNYYFLHNKKDSESNVPETKDSFFDRHEMLITTMEKTEGLSWIEIFDKLEIARARELNAWEIQYLQEKMKILDEMIKFGESEQASNFVLDGIKRTRFHENIDCESSRLDGANNTKGGKGKGFKGHKGKGKGKGLRKTKRAKSNEEDDTDISESDETEEETDEDEDDSERTQMRKKQNFMRSLEYLSETELEERLEEIKRQTRPDSVQYWIQQTDKVAKLCANNSYGSRTINTDVSATDKNGHCNDDLFQFPQFFANEAMRIRQLKLQHRCCEHLMRKSEIANCRILSHMETLLHKKILERFACESAGNNTNSTEADIIQSLAKRQRDLYKKEQELDTLKKKIGVCTNRDERKVLEEKCDELQVKNDNNKNSIELLLDKQKKLQQKNMNNALMCTISGKLKQNSDVGNEIRFRRVNAIFELIRKVHKLEGATLNKIFGAEGTQKRSESEDRLLEIQQFFFERGKATSTAESSGSSNGQYQKVITHTVSKDLADEWFCHAPVTGNSRRGSRDEESAYKFRIDKIQDIKTLYQHLEWLHDCGIPPPLKESISKKQSSLDKFNFFIDIEIPNPTGNCSAHRAVAMESDFLNPYCPIWHAIGEAMHNLLPKGQSVLGSTSESEVGIDSRSDPLKYDRFNNHQAILLLGSGFKRGGSDSVGEASQGCGRYEMRMRLVFPNVVVTRVIACQIRHYICNRLQHWLDYERIEESKIDDRTGEGPIHHFTIRSQNAYHLGMYKGGKSDERDPTEKSINMYPCRRAPIKNGILKVIHSCFGAATGVSTTISRDTALEQGGTDPIPRLFLTNSRKPTDGGYPQADSICPLHMLWADQGPKLSHNNISHDRNPTISGLAYRIDPDYAMIDFQNLMSASAISDPIRFLTRSEAEALLGPVSKLSGDQKSIGYFSKVTTSGGGYSNWAGPSLKDENASLNKFFTLCKEPKLELKNKAKQAKNRTREGS